MSHWSAVLEEVIRDRRPVLVGYASLFARDRAAAEDLVQEALVRVFARPRRLPDAHGAEKYVRQAIRTVFIDEHRKRVTWRSRAHLFAIDEPAAAAEHAAAAAVDVGAALNHLSPRERACIVLRHFDDLPVAEIAAELRIGEGAVKRYLFDATRKLRDLLDVADDDVHEGVEPAAVRFYDGRSGA